MRLVDSGYLSWSYGAQGLGVNGWNVSRSNYARPTGTIMVMDSKVFSYREDFYPNYKSRRREKTESSPDRLDIRDRVREFQEILREDEWMNLLSFPGLEADDIITAFGLLHKDPEPLLVIGIDKDLLQLPGSPLALRQLIGTYRTIEHFKESLPKAVMPFVNQPRDVLLCLALLGDHSDSIPRLIPPRKLEILLDILQADEPFLHAQDLFEEDFNNNLYLAVLPGPWVFDPIPFPWEVPALLESGEYYKRPFHPAFMAELLAAMASALNADAFKFRQKVLVKSLGY